MGHRNNEDVKRMDADLQMKLDRFEKKRDKLVLELDEQFDADKWRELQIVNHHIECTENRINGDFNVKYDCDVYNLTELKQQ